jgi:glutathione S-transferase
MDFNVEKPTLWYWPAAGLGAAARLAFLHAVGADGFDCKVVTDYAAFAAKCEEPECALLNLPFVVFPGAKAPVSQSNAVLTAIGRRFNLNGATVEEQDRVDELLCSFSDFHPQYVSMSYGCKAEEFESYKESFMAKSWPYYVGGIDKVMAVHGGKFLAGNTLTVADFKAWCFVNAVRHLTGAEKRADTVKQWPRLHAWALSMEELPAVQAYDAKYGSWAINGGSAHWGNGAPF